jgi:hypothetical protein
MVPSYGSPVVPRFVLQFDPGEIRAYAARDSFEGDARLLALGQAARERGYYRLGEFVEVCRWKTPRSAPQVARNRAAEVRSATRIAVADDTPERERMRALLALHGVGWPTASVLLHLTCPDRWPILDVRALHALGVRGLTSYSYALWEEYVEVFRALVAQTGVDGRTVDRGLWSWSAAQEQSPYRPVP